MGFATPPETADTGALRGMVGKVDFATPLRNQYRRAEDSLSRSYQNPLGAYTTADVRDKAVREQKMGLEQDLGGALADAAMANQQNAFGQQATLAGLTAPRMYNSQSTVSQPFTTGDTLQFIGNGLSILA